MDKEKIIEILEDYEFFVDDDFGGHYEHIDCSQRARIPLGIVNILDYISNLEQQVKKQKEVIDRILGEAKETRNIINNNQDDNMLSKGCLLSYLEIVEDLLKEMSE